MLTRRKFIISSSITCAGLVFLNSFPIPLSKPPNGAGGSITNKRILYGNARYGCSTPKTCPEYLEGVASGVVSFEHFAFTAYDGGIYHQRFA